MLLKNLKIGFNIIKKGNKNIYCSKCGEKIDDNALICPKCGCETNNLAAKLSEHKTVIINQKPESKAALVLGILAVIFGALGGILGLVFGIIGAIISKRKIDRVLNFIGIGLFVAWLFTYIIICI